MKLKLPKKANKLVSFGYANNIPPSYTNELCGLKQKVESIWKNIGSPKPSWLDHVTIELVGVNRRHELSVERDNLESQLRAAEEERRREAEALLQNEIVKIAKKYGLDTAKVDEILSIAKKYGLDTAKVDEILSIAKKYDLDITKVYEILKIAKKYGLDAAKVDEILRIAKKYDLDAAEVDEILRIAKRYRLDTTRAYELYRLLKELGPLGFTHSRQLSIHIIRYKLGYRYPHISGIVTMEDGGTAWEFPGGFPPEIYTIICMELRLANQGTSARAIGFTPFKDIY
ncbi:cold shock domain-containing protein [Oscillatoria nigro-viridis]|nr:cold shock domain-containing protein [Oscillatoria nigro-viridis]